ncbi:MAG TPA: DUF5715 family protein [Pyrinomonadaceae bacterium]|nr:DUF5715 family protein [Pyrinomonadaceae bacterium]
MVEERSRVAALKPWMIIAAAALAVAVAVAALYVWRRGRGQAPPAAPLEQATASVDDPLKPQRVAVQRVEEDRGVPVGNKADVEVPAELKLYKDRRRFLAIQVAEWREQKYEIPDDFADLAEMTRRGEFAALPVFGGDYILYGVGLRADDELTYFDPKTLKSVPLFGSQAEAEAELARLKTLLEESETKIRGWKEELAKLKRTERAARKEIDDQIAETRKTSEAAKKRRELIDSYYKDAPRAEMLAAEYRRLTEAARDFGGRSYDLRDSDARKAFKVSLLSALRPEARQRLEEMARAYRQKFDRPLPVTSVVRTVEYQRQLGDAGNPNAIRINVPPHTTGLAFDIYTYYMAADEQQFLMDEIARLEREGRLEALRENRYHIHVFAFPDSKPPDEKLIQASLNLKAGGDEE